MKRTIVGILAAVAVLAASIVWYSCTKEEEGEYITTGSIYGTVTDYATGEPIGRVNVKLTPNGTTTLTGSNGVFEFKDVKAGKYSLSFSKAEYADLEDDFVIELDAGKKVQRDVQMRKKIASLMITDMQGNPLDTLDFGSEESVTVKTFNIFNDGTETLTCAVEYECEWITNVSGLENPIPSGQTAPVSVRIDRVALADGDNSTFVYITSGNGSNEILVKASFLGTAVISTSNATDVTATSATLAGNISDDGGRPVTARGICYGASQTPTIDGDHTEDGSGTGSFIHNITGLSSSTTYYARAYATNRNGTYYSSNIVSFTTSNGMPTVTTTAVSNITYSSAKSGGNVTNNGGFNVTARGVCWNTMGGPQVSDEHTSNGSGNGSFSSNITGLDIGTTYYVRAYATNQSGTSYGEEKTFTTPSGNMNIALSEPTSITATSAICSAEITDDGGVPVADKGICWATTQNPTANGQHVSLGMGSGTFTATLTELTPSTTYYVRAYGVSQAGTTYSTQQTFSTTSGLPTVSTSTVTNITATTAKCGGNITDNGGFNVTARGVCWNTTGNPTTNDSYKASGSGNGSFTCNMSNLTAGTTYYVRAYATNSQGTKYGNDVTFTTSSGSVAMTLSAATNITATSATCNVNITDDGGASITERGICWSTTQNPTKSGSHTSSGSGVGSFSATASGLSTSTTYYVRAYATNAAGTSYSSQVNFTTNNGMPQVTTDSVSSVTATNAVCSGNATSDGGFTITAKGFCWSTSQYPTVSSTHSDVGGGTGSFTGSLTNLQVNTTYYVRAYATNSKGTSYGLQESFTTENGLPTVTTTAPTLNGTTVATGGHVTSDGGFTVTARGICFGALPYPDLTSTYSHTTNGSGTGYYSSSFSLPNGSGTYYIRAYATNANGTSYGAQVIMSLEYLSLPTFAYNGHTYRVAPDPHTSYTDYISWTAANTYCQNLTAYGYSDWRMPTIEELETMYQNRNTIGGFINPVNIYGSYYHSTTSYNGYSYDHYQLNWRTGTREHGYDSGRSGGNGNTSCHVRPIRMEN